MRFLADGTEAPTQINRFGEVMPVHPHLRFGGVFLGWGRGRGDEGEKQLGEKMGEGNGSRDERERETRRKELEVLRGRTMSSGGNLKVGVLSGCGD